MDWIPLIWSVSWQAMFAAGVVWAITRVAVKAPAAWRYALWTLVLLKLLVSPFAGIPSDWMFRCKPMGYYAGLPSLMAGSSVPGNAEHMAQSTVIQPHIRMEPVASAVSRHGSVVEWRCLLEALWIAGVLVTGGVLLARMTTQRRLTRHSFAADGDLESMLIDCASVFRISRLPDLRLSHHVATPMLIGLLRPVILLPAGIRDLCQPTDLRAMLMHELAHAKRWDMTGVWLHQLALMLFFFHPAVWLAGREMKRERELACDELVLSGSGISRKEYAAGYVLALKLANSRSVCSVVAAMAEPFGIEKRRLNMILSRAVPRMSARWVLVLLAISVAVIPHFTAVNRVIPGVPTGPEIAQAMLDQEAASGASLEVKYTYEWKRFSDGRPDDGDISRYHYIRTPEAMRAEFVDGNGRRTACSYDRVTGASREREGRSQVRIGHGPILRLAGNREFLETTRYQLSEGPLCERIRFGTVSKQMEKVDGHGCWRVEIPARGLDLRRYIVWVDPAIGYNPRRIEWVWVGEKPTVIMYKDYSQMGRGFWFPRQQILTYALTSRDWTFTCVDVVDSIAVDRRIPKSKVMDL